MNVVVKNCHQRSGLAAGLAFITVSPEQKLLIYFEDEGNNKKPIMIPSAGTDADSDKMMKLTTSSQPCGKPHVGSSTATKFVST